MRGVVTTPRFSTAESKFKKMKRIFILLPFLLWSLSLRNKGCKSSNYEIYTLFFTPKNVKLGVFVLFKRIIFVREGN